MMRRRVKPFNPDDLQPPPERPLRGHVGRVLTPGVFGRQGEYFYRVEILSSSGGELRILNSVREVTVPGVRTAGLLGPGDVVLVNQPARNFWTIAGVLADPADWEGGDPPQGFRSGDVDAVATPEGFVLHHGPAAVRGAGGQLSARAPAVHVEAEGLTIDADGARIRKRAGELLSVWGEAVRLRATDPWPGAASFRQLDIDLSATGLRLSFDAAAPAEAPNLFLAVVDPAGWAAASAAHSRGTEIRAGSTITWGDVVDLVARSIRPVNVSLVDADLTVALATGSAPTKANPMAQTGADVVPLDVPGGLALANSGRRFIFSWTPTPGAGSYRMEWVIYDGNRTHQADHPAIASLPAATFIIDERGRPPLGGLEKALFNSAVQLSPAEGGRIVDAGDVQPAVTSGVAFAASMEPVVTAQTVADADGRSRAATLQDVARMIGLAWRVTALPNPDEIETFSASPPSDWRARLYLQLVSGLDFA